MVPPDLRLPLPDALEELLAPHLAAAGLLALHQLPLDHHLRGDAGMVGARLPQHVACPRMRSKRHRMSCSVLLSAWPICSEPVTLGGGMTIE